MLPDAWSGPTTEPSKGKRMISIALWFPSLRPELVRVLVIFFIKMRSSGLNVQCGARLDWNVSNIMVFYRSPSKYSTSRPIISSCFILNPVNVHQFFKIFLINVIIWFYNLLNIFPESFLDIFVQRDVVHHHLHEVTGGVGPGCKECAEFFNELLEIIVVSLFLLDFDLIGHSLLFIETFLQN